jgi:hypothetical protein
MRWAQKMSTGKHKGKKILRRHMCRCEDNIKMALEKITCKIQDLTHVIQDRDTFQSLVSAVMTLWVS